MLNYVAPPYSFLVWFRRGAAQAAGGRQKRAAARRRKEEPSTVRRMRTRPAGGKEANSARSAKRKSRGNDNEGGSNAKERDFKPKLNPRIPTVVLNLEFQVYVLETPPNIWAWFLLISYIF